MHRNRSMNQQINKQKLKIRSILLCKQNSTFNKLQIQERIRIKKIIKKFKRIHLENILLLNLDFAIY